MNQTAAAPLVAFLEARAKYQQQLPATSPELDRVIAVQPLGPAEGDAPAQAVVLTEGHLHAAVLEIARVLTRLSNVLARIEAGRRALIDDGHVSEYEVGEDLAPRIRELLGTLRRDLAENREELTTVQTAAAALSGDNARLHTALGDVLRAFTERGYPGYGALRTHWVPVPAFEAWRRLHAELTPPQVELAAPGEVQVSPPCECGPEQVCGVCGIFVGDRREDLAADDEERAA